MKFSILCLFVQVRLSISEIAVKTKKGTGSRQARLAHLFFPLSFIWDCCGFAARRCFLHHFEPPLSSPLWGCCSPAQHADPVQAGRSAEGCCSCTVNICVTLSEVHSTHCLKVS